MPEVSDWIAPVKVPGWSFPMRGKHSPDLSHELYSFKDVLFCNVCGNVGSKQLRKLTKPCIGHANGYGKHNLDSFWRRSKLTSRISLPDQSFQNLVGAHAREQHVPQAALEQTPATLVTGADYEVNLSDSVTHMVTHSFDDPEGDLNVSSDSD